MEKPLFHYLFLFKIVFKVPTIIIQEEITLGVEVHPVVFQTNREW